jgi:hypothetical protein
MPRFRTILIVGSLAEAGYPVLTAPNGYDAIGILADNWVARRMRAGR